MTKCHATIDNQVVAKKVLPICQLHNRGIDILRTFAPSFEDKPATCF